MLALTALIVFFGLAEGVLLLLGVEPVTLREDPFVGFAPGTPLFVEVDGTDGTPVLATAPSRRIHFNLQQFQRERPEGTYRIFCLGGSTTYGRPYDDKTSFPGWLRHLLPAADPTRRWEVVNAGGVSYASYRVAELMKELAEYEPDLFVVYTGQNEFLEERTYGDLRSVPAWFRSLTGLAARTRTWAAMSLVIGKISPQAAEPASKENILPAQVAAKLDRAAGLDLYERDDALSSSIEQHFRVSLERMVEIAHSAGADILFVVPASNLRDFSPFKSQHTEGLGQPGRQRATTLLERAAEEAEHGRWPEALAALDEARSLDPRFAEIEYLRGRALFELGRLDEARIAFVAAVDEDVCPLRAPTPIQETVRLVASSMGSPLIDFDSLLATVSLDRGGGGIPGDDLFLDHVHPTIEGNRLLAMALIERLIELGTVRPSRDWGAEAAARSAQALMDGLDPGDHARGLGNAAVVLNWAGKKEEAVRLARRAVDSGVEEAKSLAILANHFALEGDPEESLRYFQRSLLADPQNPQTRFQLALALLGREEPRKAAAHLLFAIAQWPQNPRYHRHFALVMAHLGREDLALASRMRAAELDPRAQQVEPSGAGIMMPVLAVSQYPSGAIRSISQVVRDPDGAIRRVGVNTEWYESGQPRRFEEYRAGVLDGAVREWDQDGRLTHQVSSG